jgi:hypothetical protein
MDIASDSFQTLVFLVLTTLFLGSLWFFRQAILLFFGIVFSTVLFHFLVNLVVGQNLLSENTEKIWQYRILVEGIAWASLGFYLKPTSFKALTGILYGFGVLAFLGSAMALGGWLLGPVYGISAVFFAFVIGAIISVCILIPLPHVMRMLDKKGIVRFRSHSAALTMKSEVPFGPFLIAGCLIVWFAILFNLPLPF